MTETEDIIKKVSLEQILNAVNQIGEAVKETNARLDKLEIRLDNFERSTNIQFEAIREGIVHNGSKFDRLEAVVYSSRSDISNLRADIKDLGEEVHQLRKEHLVTLEK